MPGLFAADMHDQVTVAPIQSVDADRQKTIGTKTTIDCRYEKDGKVTRGPDGSVIDTKDVIYTHTELTTAYVIWPPGANTANLDEALEPSDVQKDTSLDGADTLYEVVL